MAEPEPVEPAVAEPADLRAALDATAARGDWDTWTRPTRLAFIEWIETAAHPVVRAARVARTVAEAIGITGQ
jgi:hypothetical protein